MIHFFPRTFPFGLSEVSWLTSLGVGLEGS